MVTGIAGYTLISALTLIHLLALHPAERRCSVQEAGICCSPSTGSPPTAT
jgi:hypothetical protein